MSSALHRWKADGRGVMGHAEKSASHFRREERFLPRWALAVPGGDAIIPAINMISARFDKVVATQDWHSENYISFAVRHILREYEAIQLKEIEQVFWPVHCIPGTGGAKFHKDLDTQYVDPIILKGSNPQINSYSAFFENDKKTVTGLHYYL